MSSKSLSGTLKLAWQRFRKAYINDTIIGGNPLAQFTLPGFYCNVPLKFVIALYFAFMALFIALGVTMFITNIPLPVHQDYSSIHNYQYVPDDPKININQGIKSFTTSDGVVHSQGTLTEVSFELDRKLHAPIYLYYGLTKVYQNFRSFNEGKSPKQLYGMPRNKWGGNAGRCVPFQTPGFLDNNTNLSIEIDFDSSSSSSDIVQKIKSIGGGSSQNEKNDDIDLEPSKTLVRKAGDFTYNPCGSFPWAMFNDTFRLLQSIDDSPVSSTTGRLICSSSAFDAAGNPLPVEASLNIVNNTGGTNELNDSAKESEVVENHCSKKGISLKGDSKVLFGKLRTDELTWSLRYPFQTSNDYLRNGWYLNEPGHALPDPEDLDLQVWMHTAVLPSFKKLFRIIDVDLEPGYYQMSIQEFYDVTSFKGKKFFEMREAHSQWKRSKSLAVVFIILGIIAFVLGLTFTFQVLFISRHGKKYGVLKLNEPKRSWYVFDPSSSYFETYNALRMRRYVPVRDLENLRKLQSA